MSDVSGFWQIFLTTASEGLNTKNDVLIAFVHFFLTKNNFLCLGVGEDRAIGSNDQAGASELLPPGWNQMDGIYKLRYINNDKLYLLTGLPTEGLLIANLVSSDNLSISNVTFNVEDTVTTVRLTENTRATAKAVIKDFNAAIAKLKTELLEPVFKGNSQAVTTQTQATGSAPRRQPSPPRMPEGWRDDRNFGGVLPGVGVGDLDPLGRGGSGNLFVPPRLDPVRGGFPGFVPPGARFDPFGPGIGRRPGFEPDPDHERPPGYDDMFM